MLHGWLAPAFEGVNLWLCGAIIALFLYGLVHCFFRMWCAERDIARIREGRIAEVPAARAFAADGMAGRGEALSMQANLLRLRMHGGISVVRNTANTLVLLGLVGTVSGWILKPVLLKKTQPAVGPRIGLRGLANGIVALPAKS